MENQSAETLNNSPNQIKRSIFRAAIFVFQQVFDPKEHQGIKNLTDSIDNILGTEIYELIYNEISSEINKKYKLVIQKLLFLGRLKEFIEGLPEEDGYKVLGNDKKEKVDEKCREILKLIPLLTDAQIEEINRESDRSFIDNAKVIASTGAKVAGDIVVAAAGVTVAGIALVGMGIASFIDKINNNEEQE